MNPIKESAAEAREECQGCGKAGVSLMVVEVGPNLFSLCQGCTVRLSLMMADTAENIPPDDRRR